MEQSEEETRARDSFSITSSVCAQAAASERAIARSRVQLKRFERAVQRQSPATSSKPPVRFPLRYGSLTCAARPARARWPVARRRTSTVRQRRRGTGRASEVISNDRIAGLDETRLTLIDPEPVGTTRAAFDLRNNLIFSAGALQGDRARAGRISYISAMAASPGPGSRQAFALACLCFLNTTVRKYGLASIGTCRACFRCWNVSNV